MKQRIRLTESDLHKVIKESARRVLKESIDSVNIDPYGTDAESYHSPSDDEIKKAEAFDKKYRTWRNNPDCRTLEGLIEWGYYNRRNFTNGKYSIDNFLCDLYHKTNSGF